MNFQKLDCYEKAAEQACRFYTQATRGKRNLLHLSENASFLITMPDSLPCQVMRVARIGYHTLEEIKAELQFVELAAARIPVARPVRNCHGDMVTIVEEEGQTYLCVMFPYLEGTLLNPRKDKSACDDFRQTGRIAAILHQLTMEWKDSRGLARPHWNYEAMLGPYGLFGNWRNCRELSLQEYEVIDFACRTIKERLERYGKNHENYGLIHSDLRSANLLKTGSVIQVIDFDDCGFGWHMYDLAASLSFAEEDRRLSKWIKAWLEGYQTLIPLKREDLQEIPTFIIARRIQLLAWISSHEDSDPVKDLYLGFAAGTVRLAEEYLLLQQEIRHL